MAGIEDFVSFEDVKPIDDELVLLIDGHNIAYITVFSTISSDKTDNGPFVLWRHSFLSKLFSIITDLKPTKVILAFDTKGSWRYDIYDEYKANRKKQYGKNPLNKEAFMNALNEMIEDMQTVFSTIHTIKAEACEGDDIIAILAKNVFNKENQEVIVVSGDTDLNQLLIQKNVRQYNPLKNEFYNVINPQKELDIKILSGDKSDNITPIRRGVGVKTAEKILGYDDGVDEFIAGHDTELEKKVISERYERNKKLIDLNFIPSQIKNRILNAYDEFEVKPLDGKVVMKYLMKRRLHDLRHKWGRISKYLKNLD